VSDAGDGRRRERSVRLPAETCSALAAHAIRGHNVRDVQGVHITNSHLDVLAIPIVIDFLDGNPLTVIQIFRNCHSSILAVTSLKV